MDHPHRPIFSNKRKTDNETITKQQFSFFAWVVVKTTESNPR